MKVFRVSTGTTYNDLKVNEWPQEAVETNHAKYSMIYGMVVYVEADDEGEAVEKAHPIFTNFIDKKAEDYKNKLNNLIAKYSN